MAAGDRCSNLKAKLFRVCSRVSVVFGIGAWWLEVDCSEFGLYSESQWIRYSRGDGGMQNCWYGRDKHSDLRFFQWITSWFHTGIYGHRSESAFMRLHILNLYRWRNRLTTGIIGFERGGYWCS